jgi:hypothetical protein
MDSSYNRETAELHSETIQMMILLLRDEVFQISHRKGIRIKVQEKYEQSENKGGQMKRLINHDASLVICT